MKKLVFLAVLALAGCAQIEAITMPTAKTPETGVSSAAPPPPRGARTVEEFDTTTASERKVAATTAAGGRLLGTAVVSLGDPSRPGFWLETPLVSSPGKGRVVFAATGRSAAVDLLPGTSDRLSLAAMRLIEAPLTGLVEVRVFAD